MKNKKLLSILLCLMLALSLCIALAGCGGDSGDDTGDGGKTDGGVTGGDLTLIENGAPTFQFVLASDSSTAAQTLSASLFKTVNKILDTDAEIVTETADNATSVEIIIGTPSFRGDEYKIDYHYLGPEGYAVKVVGTKVLVLFGSDTAIPNALDHVKEKLFGITSKTKELTNVVATSDKLVENKQEFTLKSATIAGNDIRDYKLVYNTEEGLGALTTLQTNLYKKAGIWLYIAPESEVSPSDKIIYFNYLGKDSEKSTPNGYRAYVDGEDLIFEGEFPNKFYTEAASFINTKFTNFTGASSSVDATYSENSINHRNIYYSEFGAKGNGTTNDFKAIQRAHDEANEFGHTVHADADAVYYIGKTGGESISVKTDTYWHGCKFIFDDSLITVCPCGTCSECQERLAAIFVLESDATVPTKDHNAVLSALKAALPLNGGYGESDNTVKIPNWPLNYDSLIMIGSSERKVFIRHGANADGGDELLEVILVRKDGTIHESTPLTYDYTQLSWISVIRADDKPITVDGGGAMIETIANTPGEDEQSNYNAFSRNIVVLRSNSTVCNFDHRVLDEQIWRAPYAGIITVQRANNTTFKNITLQQHKSRFDMKGVTQGTYEIGGAYSNDIKYYNVKAINFFCDGALDSFKGPDGGTWKPGEVAYRGIMGTNYCRNFYFDGCVLNSFDAHKGLGNLTIVNSTFEHINLIGSGKAVIRNSTVYIDGRQTIFNLRQDYGSTWRGDMEIENVVMKYSKSADVANRAFSVINVSYIPDNDFDSIKNPDYDPTDPDSQKYINGDGCTNWLPINVSIKGISLVRYTYEYVSPSEIIETHYEGTETLYLFSDSIHSHQIKRSPMTGSTDISKFESEGGAASLNRYLGTQRLEVSDSYEITLIHTPQFKDMVYILNGEEQENWYKGEEK